MLQRLRAAAFVDPDFLSVFTCFMTLHLCSETAWDAKIDLYRWGKPKPALCLPLGPDVGSLTARTCPFGDSGANIRASDCLGRTAIVRATHQRDWRCKTTSCWGVSALAVWRMVGGWCMVEGIVGGILLAFSFFFLCAYIKNYFENSPWRRLPSPVIHLLRCSPAPRPLGVPSDASRSDQEGWDK